MLLPLLALFVSCTTDEANRYYSPVRYPEKTPEESYEELGVLTVTGFAPSETAKMHNAIRAKAAPLGADAVIVTDEGIYTDPWAGPVKYASGVAIAYKRL